MKMKIVSIVAMFQFGIILGISTAVYGLKNKSHPGLVQTPSAQPAYQTFDINKANVKSQILYFRTKQVIDSLKLDRKLKYLNFHVEQTETQQIASLKGCVNTPEGMVVTIYLDPKTAQDVDGKDSEMAIMKPVLACLSKEPEFI